MDIVAFIVPALVGVVVGLLSGLLGIGGGTIMVPVFRLLFGLSPVASTATSLFAIIPTSVSGAVTHMRNKTCLPALGLAMGLGGACTSPVGVWLASVSPGWAVMVVAALIVGFSAVNMLRKALNTEKGKPSPSRGSAVAAGAEPASGMPRSAARPSVSCATTAPASPSADLAAQKLSRRQLGLGVLIGLAAGLLSGYVGVGGGFIMVPLMVSSLGIAMRQASGTSLIAVMILAIPGVVEQGLLGNIDYLAGIAIVVGSIPGAVVGAKLAARAPERLLRLLFGGFLLVAAVLLAVNEFGILG